MGLNARKLPSVATGTKQEPLEAGTYDCRMVQVIDVGVQDQRAHKGKAKPPIQQLRLTYEFTDEFCLDEDGEEMLDKPRWLSETIPFHPLTSDLATSTKRYYAIDPDEKFEGDFDKLVDIPINVTVVNKNGSGKNSDKVYNNIGAVSKMRKKDADKCAPLVNPVTVFSIDEPDKDAWDVLPQWLQDDIRGGHEFAGSPLDVALGGKAKVKEEEPEEEPQDAAEPAEVKDDKPW